MEVTERDIGECGTERGEEDVNQVLKRLQLIAAFIASLDMASNEACVSDTCAISA